MRHSVYSIHDRVSELYAPIYQAVNDGTARRAAVRALGEVPDYDKDAFSLVRIGYFDDQTGVLVVEDNPVEVSMNIPNFRDVDSRDFQFKEGM